MDSLDTMRFMKTTHTSDSKVAEGGLIIKGALVFASVIEGC